jgi:hypothetical protein
MKFSTSYSCWHIGRHAFYIIASEATTGHVEVMTTDLAGNVVVWDTSKALPDLRLFYPCRFDKLPLRARANLRYEFGLRLEEKFGCDDACKSTWAPRVY